jgi:hypothetical protein
MAENTLREKVAGAIGKARLQCYMQNDGELTLFQTTDKAITCVLDHLIAEADSDETTEGVCGGCIIGGDVYRWLKTFKESIQ